MAVALVGESAKVDAVGTDEGGFFQAEGGGDFVEGALDGGVGGEVGGGAGRGRGVGGFEDDVADEGEQAVGAFLAGGVPFAAGLGG